MLRGEGGGEAWIQRDSGGGEARGEEKVRDRESAMKEEDRGGGEGGGPRERGAVKGEERLEEEEEKKGQRGVRRFLKNCDWGGHTRPHHHFLVPP